MRAATIKNSRIDLRVNLGQKDLLEQGAAAQNKRLSDFMIAASLEAAEIALANQCHFTLNEEQMGRFLASLEEPPKVIPQLRELLERKSVLEG